MRPLPSNESSAAIAVRRIFAGLGGLLLCWANGCASTPYHFGRFHPDRPGGADMQPIVVEYGQPNKTLDRIGWVVGFPARLLTMKKNVNDHRLSPETLEKLRVYLEENDITDVVVVVNKYDPQDQWKRLRENDRISPFWRYSVGSMTCLGYTLFPNRIFGGDRYNPFTNTLNLSSDVPALVLSEAAYAKDIHAQRFPGAYASIVNDLPVLSVFRKARATSDVLGYARVHGDWPVEKEAYHVMYPHMGVGLIGPAGSFIPVVGPFMDLGGAVAGLAAGRTVAAVQESRRPKTAPDPAAPATLHSEIQYADMREVPRPDEGSKSTSRSGIVPAGDEKPADSDEK